jgi:hypothetical protein
MSNLLLVTQLGYNMVSVMCSLGGDSSIPSIAASSSLARPLSTAVCDALRVFSVSEAIATSCWLSCALQARHRKNAIEFVGVLTSHELMTTLSGGDKSQPILGQKR